ncbi:MULTISPECIES: hypothetical protein [Mycobacterium]|uniref:ESX-1 secretion-associated protein n=5 Tax=Mycobacterium ulcerans group TaxID=2993898 RepID=A0A3E2MR65_MYCMR|nr:MULTISPECIES: hypothetical protein [Mycobacterium]AGC60306.1 putative alanine and proline rich protein [Mycobacterium liflandii 128FXT]EPQ45146.1 RD1 region associated protein [Mycobacterium sp. 012931]EPQ70962.1 hypothetical protein MMMB2_4796 [Mycobacterium marinum MB2]MBC9862440.1 RD1 region associated protein [Mycobacterium pseudoshottsii]MDC8975190.1 hypothetical protein [Mycobacterium marinum]
MTTSKNPVTVDAPVLAAAGDALRGLSFPSPPKPPIGLEMDYAVIAANEVLPHIYFAVKDVLNTAQSTLHQLGSNIVTAANTYTNTDKTLGEQLSQYKFQPPAAANPAPAGTGVED